MADDTNLDSGRLLIWMELADDSGNFQNGFGKMQIKARFRAKRWGREIQQAVNPVQAGVCLLSYYRGLCRARGPSGSRRSYQQSLRAQVLVDIRPVNAVASSRDAPVGPLLRCRMEQSGKPGQRSSYGSSVIQINADRVLRDAHIQDTFTRLGFRSIHSKPPLAHFGAPI